MSLYQAEQHCALGVHMVRLLYSTVQRVRTSLASVEVLFTNFKIGYKQKTENRKQTENKQKTDSGVYRLAPASKKYDYDTFGRIFSKVDMEFRNVAQVSQ